VGPEAPRRTSSKTTAKVTGAAKGWRWRGRSPTLPRAHLDLLTDRETEVLRAVAHGRSNAEIAAELFISYATAKTQVSRLLTKLQVRDRAQLVMLA